jgi:cobalt transporter subunit CbtA
MAQLRRLLVASILTGAVAGGVLFLFQYVALEPLILRAETYERASADAHDADHAWEPAPGFERTAYTAIGTVLTGVAFAAITLGLVVAMGLPIDGRRGFLLGLLGFAAFVVAPSIGLRPKPPGVPGADVPAAQAWWAFATASTAAGLIVLFRMKRTALVWGLAVFAILLPHLVGAPQSQPSTDVPTDLVARFAWLSIATRLPFWLIVGAMGGYLLKRGDLTATRSEA